MQSMVLTMASEVEMACTLDSLYHQLSSFAKSFAYWAGFNGTHSVSEVLGAVTEMMGAEREHQIRTSHVNFARCHCPLLDGCECSAGVLCFVAN